ncbi:hypothetical protein DaAHT2_1980 [Desulfurivibrio alkaliphilus AHT 2]|uniref:Uncharacterized protein n=1 Tax=Desulfurivibrio alkaliphilus (strain DSM 19089 / UNIQEM U267 / AHT2) TaxID=589865 RepID=D6Z533_DESAT|nr:hypothetical protein DaAHT2_1980 [Desulfurivibrio alkaliphilus AHT 2]
MATFSHLELALVGAGRNGTPGRTFFFKETAQSADD